MLGPIHILTFPFIYMLKVKKKTGPEQSNQLILIH